MKKFNYTLCYIISHRALYLEVEFVSEIKLKVRMLDLHRITYTWFFIKIKKQHKYCKKCAKLGPTVQLACTYIHT